MGYGLLRKTNFRYPKMWCNQNRIFAAFSLTNAGYFNVIFIPINSNNYTNMDVLCNIKQV